jgi:hypothetical protein
MNLSQPLGLVPPGVPTLPVSTLRKNRLRATCQPPLLPAAAERQMWADSALPAVATMSVSSRIFSTGTRASAAANSKVYGA